MPEVLPKDEFVQRIRELMPEVLPGEKVAIRVDDDLGSAVVAAAMAELYGKENVVAILCPHLSIENPGLTNQIIEKYCGSRRVIPVTMAVADLCNELKHAGFDILSSGMLQEMVASARKMVFKIIKANGYHLAPTFMWSDAHIRLLAKEFGIEAGEGGGEDFL